MSSDMVFLVGLVGASLLLLILLIAVAIVRGIRKNASESSGAPKGDGVHVITHGRDGEILYVEQGNTCRFYWEFLGGDALVGVTFPKKDQWDTAIPWATGRQEEIMKKVAAEVVRKKAPGHKVRWADGSFDIL